MPRSKILRLALSGALAAAIIAIIAGIVLYVPSINEEISASAENYSQLAAVRVSKIVSGLILMASGAAVFVVSSLGLIITVLIGRLKTNNKK